jgi:hypothetical protein
MPWDLEFFKPIPVSGKRKPLVTLRDAVEYMTRLPRAERGADHWWPAVTLLAIIGERGGCMFFASALWRLGFARACRIPHLSSIRSASGTGLGESANSGGMNDRLDLRLKDRRPRRGHPIREGRQGLRALSGKDNARKVPMFADARCSARQAVSLAASVMVLLIRVPSVDNL